MEIKLIKLNIKELQQHVFFANDSIKPTNQIAAETHFDGTVDIALTVTNTIAAINPVLEPNQTYKIKLYADMINDTFKGDGGNNNFIFDDAYLIIKTAANGTATGILRGLKRTQNGNAQVANTVGLLKQQFITLTSEFYDKTMNLNGVLEDMDEVDDTTENEDNGCRFSVAIKLEDLFP